MQQILTTIVENGDPLSGVTQNLDGETEGELTSNSVVVEKGKKYHVTFRTIYSKKEVDE